jgi:uncharacterized protein (DUF885 family)
MKRLIPVVALYLAGCVTEVRPPPPPTVTELVEGYFGEYLKLDPLTATRIGDNRYNDRLPNTIGPLHRRELQTLNERYLAESDRIDPDSLSPADRITLEIFQYERQRYLGGLRFPSYLLPVDHMYSSLPLALPVFGSGSGEQPFRDLQDYENWLERLAALPAWLDQSVVNMREGIAKGVVQPRTIVAKLLPQLDALAVDRPEDSTYSAPFRKFPEAMAPADQERLRRAYADLMRRDVLPAYRRLRDFVRDEYLPKARDSVAWTALPDGQAWYAHLARTHTTTGLTPDQVHEIGLSEVARIRAEMDEVRRKVGFSGDLAAFFEFVGNDPQFFYTRGPDLIEAYGDVRKRVEASLPKLFSVFPKAGLEIREVEAFRAATAPGAFYQRPTADGSRPGVFYVNTYELKAQPKYGMETLFLHEASPGHHFQIAIQQELGNLPRFRRFGGYTAFGEGWALYAEFLGPELGLFADPYQYYGRLNDEMLRAMRLVVDTGLHAKGWTREQAVQYMLDNSSLAEHDVRSEVDRYIAWPGQALSYKVGDLRIQALRREAQDELGPKFDIRDFHREVLSDGSVPLDVLERKVGRWVEAHR